METIKLVIEIPKGKYCGMFQKVGEEVVDLPCDHCIVPRLGDPLDFECEPRCSLGFSDWTSGDLKTDEKGILKSKDCLDLVELLSMNKEYRRQYQHEKKVERQRHEMW